MSESVLDSYSTYRWFTRSRVLKKALHAKLEYFLIRHRIQFFRVVYVHTDVRDNICGIVKFAETPPS